jgi:hypothetical protein
VREILVSAYNELRGDLQESQELHAPLLQLAPRRDRERPTERAKEDGVPALVQNPHHLVLQDVTRVRLTLLIVRFRGVGKSVRLIAALAAHDELAASLEESGWLGVHSPEQGAFTIGEEASSFAQADHPSRDGSQDPRKFANQLLTDDVELFLSTAISDPDRLCHHPDVVAINPCSLRRLRRLRHLPIAI